MAMLIVCACTPIRPEDTPRATATDHRVPGRESLDLPVITTMRTRDREVVVFASAGGLRFTVRNEGGDVLAERVDHASFLAAFPTLGQHFDTAFAGETLWLDASVEREPLPEK